MDIFAENSMEMSGFCDLYKIENYKQVFENFYWPLVDFASGRIADAVVAEDIVQNIFVYMWNKELKFENTLALRTYLYRSVLNRCRNYIRDTKLRDAHVRNMYDGMDKSDNTLLNGIIQEEVYRQLAKAMNMLPPRCREISEMAQQGMSSSEIAVQLGLAVETVKKQRKIARKILQSQLDKNICLLLFSFWTDD